jgi:hypothetical protein
MHEELDGTTETLNLIDLLGFQTSRVLGMEKVPWY